MKTETQAVTHNPAWWTDQNTSDWDRVKAAAERDWEQTKADFSKKGGHELNQNGADTIMQSVGSQFIPPIDEKTRPTEPKVAAKAAEKARENMNKESVKTGATVAKAHDQIEKERSKFNARIGDARSDLAEQKSTASDEEIASAQAKENHKIANAQEKEDKGIAKAHTKIDGANAKLAESVATWREAEQDVRYGYAVRSRYPESSRWDDKLETELRGEWDRLDTGRPWNAAGTGIHRGWDFAGKHS